MQPTLVAEVQDDVRQTAFESAALSPIPKSSPKTVAELRPLTACFLWTKTLLVSSLESQQIPTSSQRLRQTNKLAEFEADTKLA